MSRTGIMPTRRRFLSGSVSVLGARTLLPLAFTITPKEARAEPITAVIVAVVAIAGAIANLTAKGDGTRQLFAILNVKLDHIIELQNETIKAIGIVSKQIEILKAQVPNMLVSESFRQQLVQISSFSSRLIRLTDRAKSNNWTDEDTKTLDKMVADSWILVSNIKANLQNSSANDEVGLDIVRHAMPALYAAYQLVPALTALDGVIDAKVARRSRHGNTYRDIIRDAREAIALFSTKHLIQQKTYQENKVAEQNRVLSGSPYSQWLTHLESAINDQHDGKSVAISVNTKFGTSGAFGPCTHGDQSDDVNWAIKIGQDANKYTFNRNSSNWNTFDLYIPAAVSGTAFYNNGQRAGFRELSIVLGEAQAIDLGPTQNANLPNAKRRSQALNEGFAHTFYPTKEYYCPGVGANDRHLKAKENIVRSRDSLPEPIEIFRKANLDRTEHLWNGIGIDQMINWANQVEEDMKKMEKSV